MVLHNSKGEELAEIEAKMYLEVAFPDMKNIEIKDKPDLRVKTSEGEIGIEVVVSYPQKQLEEMHKYGDTNTYEYKFNNIIKRFKEKQEKSEGYDKVYKLKLFIISGTPLLLENQDNMHKLLELFLNSSNDTFVTVYFCDIEALYEYDLANKEVHKVTDFQGERSVIAMKARKRWEQYI